jgi:hypothetical protein
VVTPRLARVLPPDYALPTDSYIPPTRSEYFWNGQLEGKPPEQMPPPGSPKMPETMHKNMHETKPEAAPKPAAELTPELSPDNPAAPAATSDIAPEPIPSSTS